MAARQRKGNDRKTPSKAPVPVSVHDDSQTAGRTGGDGNDKDNVSTSLAKDGQQQQTPVWIVLAVASGACAAVNGVFAKLTTTSLTTNLAHQLSASLGLASEMSNTVNIALRGSFLGLNLLFNGVMWGLFTAALTRGTSSTRVSIVNVSANFVITAILGWAVFGERLPLQWWVGACLLALGNVIIGRREEEKKKGDGGESGKEGG